MMRYIFILLSLFFSTFLFSQNSLKVETEYLKLIFIQQNKYLAADNYRNAELIADSIIYNNKINKTRASEFFIELAKSYNLNNDYGNSAISILRQQFLFADKTYDLLAKQMFFDACYKLNIKKNKIIEIYNLRKKTTNNFSNNMLVFLQATIKLNQKKLNKKIIKYSNFYKTISNDYPFWLHQWEFFNTIKIKNKKILPLIAFEKTHAQKKLIDYLSEKQQKYVLFKAEKYYRKNKAINQAKYYLQEYKNKNLSFFEKVKAFNQKILILI